MNPGDHDFVPLDSPASNSSPGPSDEPPAAQAEDLSVPWGWLDVAMIVPVAVGTMFLIVMLLAGGLALFHLSMPQLARPSSQLLFVAISAQILMEIALLGYLAAQIRWRESLPFWRTIGWRPLETGHLPRGVAYFGLVCGGILLAAVVTLASSAFPPKHPLPIEMVFRNRPLTVLFALTAVLVAPVVEETIFRGYLYPVAARSFGRNAGILFTGTLFGLLHGSQLWGGWWQIGLLVLVGILFTWTRAATRTVLSSFLLHVSYNSVQAVALLIAMFGPRHFPRIG